MRAMMKHILTELIDKVEPTVEYGFMLYGELLHLGYEDNEDSNHYYQLQTSPSRSGEPSRGEWSTTNLMTAMMMVLEPDKYYGGTMHSPVPHPQGLLVAATTWRCSTYMCRSYTVIPLPKRIPLDVVLEQHTFYMGEVGDDGGRMKRTFYTTYMGGDLAVQEVYYIPAYSQLVLCIARISGEYLLLVQTEGDVVDMYRHTGNQ